MAGRSIKEIMANLPPVPDSDEEDFDLGEQAVAQMASQKADLEVGMVDPNSALFSSPDSSQFTGPDFLNREGTVEVHQNGRSVQDGFYAHDNFDSFEKLPLAPELQQGLLTMGFVRPSKIQAEALHALLGHSPDANVVGMAHHGSGKTAAFLLAALSKTEPNLNECQCIVVLPTRELAIQVSQVCRSIGRFSKHRVREAIPSRPIGRVTEQILIGTPGQIFYQFLEKPNVNRDAVRMLVIDEADELLSQGHVTRNNMAGQILNIRKKLPQNLQVLLFSATFDDQVKALAEQVAPNPLTIQVKRQDITLDKIIQFVVQCPGRPSRFDVLMNLYSILEMGQSIIFVNRVEGAQLLYESMTQQGFQCSVIYGKGMDRSLRDQTMDDFRSGRTSVLISSDLLSRGIDVLAVTCVVNYDIPSSRDPSTYVHRIGRSGRFGRKGVAINLVGDQNDDQELRRIAGHYSCQDKLRYHRAEDLEGIIDSVEQYL